jgi:preprotein translocase subunit SecE
VRFADVSRTGGTSQKTYQRCLGEDMATQTRGEATGRSKPGGPVKASRTSPALFVRQVVAELRKVIWPTRKELVTYTTVALAFIIVMVAIVTSLDYGFTKLVFTVFG